MSLIIQKRGSGNRVLLSEFSPKLRNSLSISAASVYGRLTSPPQCNLRRARRSSADKTSSKLLGLHSPSMLSPFKTSLAESDSARLGTRRTRLYMPLYAVYRSKMSACYSYSLHGRIAMLRLFCCVFALEFLFNPQFNLEPDYIIRKPIDHRILRYIRRRGNIVNFSHTSR